MTGDQNSDNVKENDYMELLKAVEATEQGRWFLEEFARRQFREGVDELAHQVEAFAGDIKHGMTSLSETLAERVGIIVDERINELAEEMKHGMTSLPETLAGQIGVIVDERVNGLAEEMKQDLVSQSDVLVERIELLAGEQTEMSRQMVDYFDHRAEADRHIADVSASHVEDEVEQPSDVRQKPDLKQGLGHLFSSRSGTDRSGTENVVSSQEVALARDEGDMLQDEGVEDPLIEGIRASVDHVVLKQGEEQKSNQGLPAGTAGLTDASPDDNGRTDKALVQQGTPVTPLVKATSDDTSVVAFEAASAVPVNGTETEAESPASAVFGERDNHNEGDGKVTPLIQVVPVAKTDKSIPESKDKVDHPFAVLHDKMDEVAHASDAGQVAAEKSLEEVEDEDSSSVSSVSDHQDDGMALAFKRLREKLRGRKLPSSKPAFETDFSSSSDTDTDTVKSGAEDQPSTVDGEVFALESGHEPIRPANEAIDSGQDDGEGDPPDVEVKARLVDARVIIDDNAPQARLPARRIRSLDDILPQASDKLSDDSVASEEAIAIAGGAEGAIASENSGDAGVPKEPKQDSAPSKGKLASLLGNLSYKSSSELNVKEAKTTPEVDKQKPEAPVEPIDVDEHINVVGLDEDHPTVSASSAVVADDDSSATPPAKGKVLDKSWLDKNMTSFVYESKNATGGQEDQNKDPAYYG